MKHTSTIITMNAVVLSSVVLLLLNQLHASEGARIFFMIPITSISEKHIYVPLIEELSKRGHDVTVATIKKSSYKSKTIKEFVPLDDTDIILDAFGSPLDGRKDGTMGLLNFPADHDVDACQRVYKNKEFQSAINQQYDLIFINSFLGSCFLPAVYKQGVPWIMVVSCAPRPEKFALTGDILPPSYVPHAFLPMTSSMSFLERVQNLLFTVYWSLFETYSYMPTSAEVGKKYVGADVPNVNEIAKNVSLIFGNSHFVLNSIVPTLPDIVEVGGMHCRPAKPLPKDLDDFISGAKDGLIYFSLGTLVKSEALPEEHIKMFISAFSKLKQRVLWKLGGPKRHDIPANVKISPWCPQQDILGHPNTKLFMSHSGLLSTQEAVYHGVPVLALPVYWDQDTNAMVSESKGFAKKVELLTLTEAELLATIKEMLTNDTYRKKAQEMSKLFRDQPQTPLDRALYWVEYVLRHKGTSHMRSAARDLNFIQYYCLDVIAALVGLIAIVLIIVYSVIMKCFSICCGSKSVKKQKRQ